MHFLLKRKIFNHVKNMKNEIKIENHKLRLEQLKLIVKATSDENLIHAIETIEERLPFYVKSFSPKSVFVENKFNDTKIWVML